MTFFDGIRDILHGATVGRYQHDLRQQTAELNDLFLLLCFMEATALPNPATLYLLELILTFSSSFTSGTGGWASTTRRSAACRAADQMLLDHSVVFFGGKGGVGKTTCSSAFALAASRAGRRVLLVSTDPAHSTSDIFERNIGSSERKLLPNLTAIEIDSAQESARYVGNVKRDIERMFSPAVVRQAHRQIEMAAASPGLAEVALLDRMIDLIVERENVYDLIVFDTAPTGHTLQLLRMPDAMTTWIQALVKHRRALLEMDLGDERLAPEDDPVLAALERRHQRLTMLRERVTDRARTSFVLVTIAERLAIEETARAADLLGETNVHLAGLIVNRVLPEGLDGDFYAARKAQEGEYLAEIARRFKTLRRLTVRQLPRDVYGLESLAAVSEQLATL